MKKILFTLLLTVLFSALCHSQFSKTHYIPPISNTGAGGQDPQGQFIYISCPSITPVAFTIKEIGGSIINGSVSRDNPYVYTIGFGYNTQLLIDSSDVGSVKNNKGYIVEAADLIYVTVRLTSSDGNFQAGGIVSKGIAALGTQFRIGAFFNLDPPTVNQNHYTFATILATENNTVVSFSDIDPAASLLNNGTSTQPDVNLNAGESFAIAVQGPNNANRDALIGALISSNKPIAVNCGSFAGSNANTNNIDLGFDQIVSVERTGNEYIFIKGNGFDITEKPFIIAHEDNTEVFINGSTTPITTLNHGDYYALDGTAFSVNNNLYIRTSKNVFAYQAIGSNGPSGAPDLANQNMHFLPPLSCQTPKTINNIPFINEVGGITNFIGTVCLVTKTGATLDFIINGTSYTMAQLSAAGYTINGPFPVTGNVDYVTYTLPGLTGNISVFSSKQIYLSYYGSSGAATYGGFYSGFTFKPEVTFLEINTGQSNCIPNVELKVNSISGFDTFQWYFNNNPIVGATNFNYFPTAPGYYKVKATLTECGLDYFSDEIPVSNCAFDSDNDLVNDNIDLDLDNDGITNCTESFGNVDLNISNPNTGTINQNTYTNSFLGQISTSSTSSPIPLVGVNNGSFVTETPPGKGYFVSYELTFNQPINLKLEYATTANTSDLINDNAEFVARTNTAKTITVLNPDNQLLIDTNYDGLYESNVTEFSSFEIRFRVNGSVPLAAGTGTFQFLGNQLTTMSIIHKNLSDTLPNKATFKFVATCIPSDYDNDGIPDQIDYDADNDTIPDFVESQGNSITSLSNTDSNQDGIDDIFSSSFTPADNDGDGIPNYLDYDSDDDGIFDIIESGSTGNGSNTNGITINPVGNNGLDNGLESSIDNGILNYTITDTDADGILNYLEADSDNDGCIDLIEAGYTDANGDGIVGDENPPVHNPNGTVLTTTGYGVPNSDYLSNAVIVINTQPQNVTTCELQTAVFTINTNPVNSYQWQLSTDNGTTWSDLNNDTTYSGVTTINLTVSNVTPAMVGYQYRVLLFKNGNACGLFSDAATLTTYALPVVASSIGLVQCDDDTDGISDVNLTVNNNFISTNYLTETFTYYTSILGAMNADTSVQILNPIAYNTATTTVYVRVENANGCFSLSNINVFVSATQIPASTAFPFYTCDDYIDAINNDYDGVSLFNFSSVTPAIQALLPATNTYTIKYFRNEADAFSELNEITDISNYRNIGYPSQQDVWVRVDSNIDNACFGLGPFVKLNVEALPIANSVSTNNIIRNCDDDHDGILNFNTSGVEATILNGQTNVTVTYTDSLGNSLPSPLPNPFTVTNQITITAVVTNNSTLAPNGPCYDEVTFQFIVDDFPEAFPLPIGSLVVCDDEVDPTTQDGSYPFDTTTIETQILNGQTGMNVTYTLADGTVLNQLPNPFNSTTQDVIATVINPINTTCTASTILHFEVNPVPNIDLVSEELVCTNLPTFLVSIDAGINDGSNPNDYTYTWYLDNVLIPTATSYSLQVNTSGIYTVEVKNSLGCSRTRTITVVSSNAATIDNISVIDLSEINSITVTVSGDGDYVYALDSSYYQPENFFDNVSMGIHTVFIKDLNGCGEVQQTVYVLGAPNYFTPNGDGIHDTWNIKGIDANFNANSIIYIFDRYGKLIKEISPIGNGWDGTYNGTLMPGDDYWFTVRFEDGRSAKGNFSLKR